jgi:hypothetical protein
MRSLPWHRPDLIARICRDIWRYLTPTASVEAQLLEAAGLLRMPARELRTVGALQFLTSRELGEMLQELPFLLRRLATTTVAEEEWSHEHIRGSIQWGRTLGVRAATGLPQVYVTAPARRAYQTPENELLVFLLDQTIALGKSTGWHRSTSEDLGRLVTQRVSHAERWSQSRMLLEVQRRPLAARNLQRVRAGRHRRRYGTVLAAYRRYRELVGQLDRHAIRHAVETHGLVTRDDNTLFELVCTFQLLDALRALGWTLGRLGLFGGALRLTGERGGERLEVTYQAIPPELSRGSVYRTIQVAHDLSPGGLRPDLVIRHAREGTTRWLLVEVKGGERPVEQAARAAAYDLLAYRTAFNARLAGQASPYGLGIAWGAGLAHNPSSEILLCTPDGLERALHDAVG